MKRLFGFAIATGVLLSACGSTVDTAIPNPTTGAVSSSKTDVRFSSGEFETEFAPQARPEIFAAGIGDCDPQPGHPHESTTGSIYGQAKVNAGGTCRGYADRDLRIRVQIELQKKGAWGRWATVKSSGWVNKIAPKNQTIALKPGDINAFAPCTPGTYRGRMEIRFLDAGRRPMVEFTREVSLKCTRRPT